MQTNSKKERKKERARERNSLLAQVRKALTIAFDLFHFTVSERREAQLTQIISHTHTLAHSNTDKKEKRRKEMELNCTEES